jgi:hypothetical protein
MVQVYVVLQREQDLFDFVQKGGDSQELIGCVVNLHPLNFIGRQYGQATTRRRAFNCK